MENILVSACLLGENCKYNGGNNYCQKLQLLTDKYCFIPICPETFGGLKSPREPAEIIKDKVLLKTGEDVTRQFINGAHMSLNIGKENNCKIAILKERSPSCAPKCIYNGKFNGTVITGQGITARLLKENGIKLYSEEDIDLLL